MTTPPLRDAATVILLRPTATTSPTGPEDPFQVFLLRRSPNLDFMAEMWVFPGGRLDEVDLSPELHALVRDLSPEEAARRMGNRAAPQKALGLFLTAIRETFEEAHLLLARRRGSQSFFSPSQEEKEVLQALRQRLDNGEISLLEVAQTLHVELAGSRFGFFAHWVTPTFENRRYDTRFFVTPCPEGQEPREDNRETTASIWLSPQEALKTCARGEILLAPPTLQTLKELTRFDSIDAVLNFARTTLPPRVLPYLLPDTPTPTLVMAGDPLYPTTGEYLESEPLRDGTTRTEFGSQQSEV